MVPRGQDVVAGADPRAPFGEFGGAAGGGADVVEVETEQAGLPVGCGQPGDQRAQRILSVGGSTRFQ